METSEFIVRWTARLVVFAYVLRLLYDLQIWPWPKIRSDRTNRIMRNVWVAAAFIYLIHIAAAFQFVHHWSHAAAYEHTAQQTARITGWHSGGGVWINYLIALWWPLDLLWICRKGIDKLPRWYVRIMHASLGFIIFNATVVFGPKWWVALGLILLVYLAVMRLRQSHNKDQI